MLSRCALLAFAATVAPLVAAHGHMSGVFIDDVYVPGPQPNSGPGDFAIRQINDIDPVKGASNPDLFCGHGSTPATLTVNATQGSVLKFAWNNGDNGPWVHNTGPVMTYMASCGSAGCTNLNDPNSTEFFKISELGRKADGTWTMADLNSALNATTSATIPSNLPDGDYIVRHELIAMQLAMTEGGVEFYPACLQIHLSGGSSTQSTAALPSGDNVVNFPGDYHDADPGLFDPNVYNGETAAEYVFPGPPLVGAASTDPSGSTSSTDVPANTSGTPTSSSDGATPSPTGCGGMSKKKKRVVKRIIQQRSLVKKSHRVARNEDYQPVARSRVMRGI